MYYSLIQVDVGDNPDRVRPGREWLGNIYSVHQRLFMAFPNAIQRVNDPNFLLRFVPDAFVQGVQNGTRNFLYRIENRIGPGSPSAVILVQSNNEPDWNYAFQNARTLLTCDPRVWEYTTQYEKGERLRFRICMNLSKRTKQIRDRNGCIHALEKSKRLAFTWDSDRDRDKQIAEWFSSKAKNHGFSIKECTVENTGWVRGWKSERIENDSHTKAKTNHRILHRSVTLNGILIVKDESIFHTALVHGIGHAKAFGFGLLSVKRD